MKYRKKPVEIEAMQYIGDASEAFEVCHWMVQNDYPWLIGDALEPNTLRIPGEPDERPDRGIWIEPEYGALMIRTLKGDIDVRYGYWVIKDATGRFHSCSDEFFQETYEEDKPWDAEGLSESIEYNKLVYDTFKSWIK